MQVCSPALAFLSIKRYTASIIYLVLRNSSLLYKFLFACVNKNFKNP